MNNHVHVNAPDVVRVQALGELGRDLAVAPLLGERRPASAGVRPMPPATPLTRPSPGKRAGPRVTTR